MSAFGSGEDLLATLRKTDVAAPNAILLDLIMPGMSGLEALETIRKEHLAKGVKIIILSNQGKDADVEKAKQLAADGYIIKASAIPSEVLAETLRTIETKSPAPSGAMAGGSGPNLMSH